MKQRTTIKKAFLLISMLGIVAFTNFAKAESIQKHPRVAEMEDSLRQKASTYLKSRFPDQPFLVNISVDALRRSTSKNGEENEKLPFFDMASDEIQDEWDDPNVSLQQLQLRTNKIVVGISVSDSISDTEVSEVKENIVQTLHLTPARDEVKVESKNWKVGSNRYLQTIMVFGIAVLFLIGLYFINRQFTQKITRALAEGAKNSATSVNGSIASSSQNMGGNNDSENHDHHPKPSKNGIKLSDPIKINEILSYTVKTLEAKAGFPSMKDMVVLDEYGLNSPDQLGAILAELNPEMRMKLFSLSTGEWWLEAMMHPAHFEFEHLEFLQKLAKQPVSSKSSIMNDMLIKVWRLNEKLPDFLRTLQKDVGLTILSFLPKGKAVDAARRAYPGGWADLLDPEFVRTILSDEECAVISSKALSLRPLQNPLAFEKHKLEMELREFLLKASIEEEREIYMASKHDSAIHEHRPPFYKVLESDEEILKGFVSRFSPEQWAFALFNVSQSDRKKIQMYFSEKQNFMFIENMKRQDRSHDRILIGKTRERIGAAFRHFKSEMELEAVQAMKDVQELAENTKNKNEKKDQVA